MILACDPGKENFAYVIMTDTGKLKKIGMFNNYFNDLTYKNNLISNINDFKEEIKRLECNELILERYIPRSMNRGNLAEIINIKIGIIFSIHDYKSVNILSAATWKNMYNRNKLWVSNDSIPEHILDAIFIGLFHLYKTERINIKVFKKKLSKIQNYNFKYYKYKGEWYYGERKKLHARGRRNSFGT